MLTPTLTSWNSQHERMQRTYARLSNRYVSSIDYDDDLRHFFQDCWHLKDWIKNDTNVPAVLRASIETEVGALMPLRIAADLANGCKHIDHTRTNREGAYVTSVSVTISPGQGVESFHTITLDDGSTLSGQDLATNAFAAWAELLKKLGLIK